MHLLQPLIPNPPPPITVEPTPRALPHPTMSSQSLTTLSPFASDSPFDPAPADGLATPRIVIPFVSMQFVWSLARPTGGPVNRANGVKHGSKHLGVVQVGCRLFHRQRDPLAAAHQMALRARFAAIRRIGPGRSALFGAGTENESLHARRQSILSASPRRSNSRWGSWCQTPHLFHARNRRQQVTPEPHPISGGSIAQGMPLRRTKIMPRTTSRLAIG